VVKLAKQRQKTMNDVSLESAHAPDDPYGIAAVRELVQLLQQSDITELVIERGEVKLHLKRGMVVAPAAPVVMPTYPSASAVGTVAPMFEPTPVAEGAPIEMPAGHTIVAPMVGTFYTAPSPKDRPFVSEGDEIHVGDAIGIVEAMKMMNEIESDVAGRVARILVKNGQPVEYGQPLMVIEPL
jgi:acetyl-CoA carboxylase biotin carboxyl carrier protein